MRLGIIGGTALESLTLESNWIQQVETRWGEPSSPLLCGTLGSMEVFFLNRHGVGHALPPHRVNYRANIAALKQLDADAILAVNAVGGITERMTPGQWVVPDQIIDYTWGREHTFADGAEDDLLHVDFTWPYEAGLRQTILTAAEQIDLPVVDGGVFGVTQGPRLESMAEITRMEQDGCDIVGMTAMPEAGLAREAGLPYASIALVVNPAAGKADREITMEEIGAVMNSASAGLLQWLEALCRQEGAARV